VLPITENEAECVIKKFKGTFSAGYDEIPEYVVKQSAKICKRTLSPYLQYFDKLRYISRKV
jgi:hypothetical protein